MKKIITFIIVVLLVAVVALGALGATGNFDNFKDGVQDVIDDIKDKVEGTTGGNQKPSGDSSGTETPEEVPNENKTNLLTISETAATLENSEGRGDYYSLETNTSYDFTIDLQQSFGSTDVELSCRLDAFGQVYLWDCYGTDVGTWVNTSDAQLSSLASIMDRFVQSVSISGNVLTLKTGFRALANSYSSTHPDDTDNFTIYVGRFVEVIDASTLEPDFKPDNEYAAYNAGHISSYVFYVIVTDSKSGAEKCLPFWMPCAFYDYDPY